VAASEYGGSRYSCSALSPIEIATTASDGFKPRERRHRARLRHQSLIHTPAMQAEIKCMMKFAGINPRTTVDLSIAEILSATVL
jgi:hypothetical protein